MRLEPRKARRSSRATELIQGEVAELKEFDPQEFIHGKDRAYLERLIDQSTLTEAELDTLSNSWWISSLDEGYTEHLAQAPGLEEYIWAEIVRFRDMYLKPFGEEKNLADLHPKEAIQVLITYFEVAKLLFLFPNSSHKDDLLDLFGEEKKVFLDLLDQPELATGQKLQILFGLNHILPEQTTTLKKKISIEAVKQEVDSTRDLDFLIIILALYPELRPQVEATFEQLKPEAEKSLRDLSTHRFQNPTAFTNYLYQAIPYTILTAAEVSLRANGILNIRLQPKPHHSTPRLPERPNV